MLWVCGTDTGVGKTLVTGALAVRLARDACRVGVVKPVASGARRRRGRGAATCDDAEFLLACAALAPFHVFREGARVAAPCAPGVLPGARCARWYREALRAVRNAERRVEVLLAEGIGGVMVPLAAPRTFLDLAAETGGACLVVARTTLGTINHVLLTITALQGHGMDVRGIVFCGGTRRGSAAQLERRLGMRWVARATGVPSLAVLPQVPDPLPGSSGFEELVARMGPVANAVRAEVTG